MKVTVQVDGVTTDHDLDISVGGMDIQEGVVLENTLGVERTTRLFLGDGEVLMLPSTIRALVFAKLSSEFPTLSVNDLHFPLIGVKDDDAANEPEEADPAVVLPMSRPDGSTVEGASKGVDPTREAETG